MIAPPRFVLPPGTELKLLGNRVSVAGRNASGYDVVDPETGEQRIVPFAAFVDYLKLPGAVIDAPPPQTGGRLQQRLGGFATSRSLPKPQQDGGMFHLALCQGVIGLREKMRAEAGNERLELTIGDLNQLGNRQIVKSIAQTLFGFPIILNTPPGGKRTVWTMPRGRTLLKHFKAFEQIHPDESPLDVLVPLHHLRGNRTPRITHRTKELMTRA